MVGILHSTTPTTYAGNAPSRYETPNVTCSDITDVTLAEGSRLYFYFFK